MMKTFPALAALVVAGSLVIPTVSQAADSQSARVSYADLNLGADAGRTALERRIAFAAATVCGLAQSQDFAQKIAAADCRDDAIARVQPALAAAVNKSRTGTVTVLDAAALIVSAQ